jgi:gliding-associated putative ABC transporter substrate-binding component GldG
MNTKSQTLLRVALVFLILVVLNIVSIRLFGRFDLTSNKVYSLSEASKTLVRSLDDKVTVHAYFTEDLPAPYNGHRRQVLDQLNDYKAFSGGKLQFEFIDPNTEKAEKEAQQQGIPPIQVQVVNNDKAEVKKGYMGLVFLYEDKKETMPVVQNLSSLEYDISSAMKRLTSKGVKKVGFLSGHGEPGLNELTKLQEMLGRQYQLQAVDLSGGKSVPQDINALYVIAPTTAVPEPVKFQIDQFLMRGGNIGFLLNKVEASLQQRSGRVVENGLDDLLACYGANINPDLVRDVQCANVTLVQQQYGFNIQSQVPFPYLPIANKFSEGSPVVKDLQNVALFFVSSVDTVEPASKGLSSDILIRSSKQSARQQQVFMFDPLERWSKEQFPEQYIPLALLVSGPFKSFYAGKPAPVDTTPGSLPPSAQPLTQAVNSRIVVIGDGDFMKDQTTSRDNLLFFANLTDFLADDSGLSSIRTKEPAQAILDPVSDGTRQTVKIVNLVLPSVLVLLYGLYRWRSRKALTSQAG